MIWNFLNTNFISAIIGGLIVGGIIFCLEGRYRKNQRILLQRLELKKRAMECFENINNLIIKIRFYNSIESFDIKDIRIGFDAVANFFYELKHIYKESPEVVLEEKIEKVDKQYQGWNEYFSFEKPEDLERLKENLKKEKIEEYLTGLKEAIVKFVKAI